MGVSVCKYNAVIFVSPMGHDVNRVCTILSRWLNETGLFFVEAAGTYPGAEYSIESYMLNKEKAAKTDLFIFLCSDEYWSNREIELCLAEEVKKGKGVLFYHGLHPCFENNPEIEKMIGLLWREKATHGDFNYWDITISDLPGKRRHPITEGVGNFRTADELFCRLENPWNVPVQVLATAYSDPEVISRWDHPGTGYEEPVLTVGNYGKGNTVNFILGHVWPFYTGHGLTENTTIALEPAEFKTMFLRSCEWAVTGQVLVTKEC